MALNIAKAGFSLSLFDVEEGRAEELRDTWTKHGDISSGETDMQSTLGVGRATNAVGWVLTRVKFSRRNGEDEIFSSPRARVMVSLYFSLSLTQLRQIPAVSTQTRLSGRNLARGGGGFFASIPYTTVG